MQQMIFIADLIACSTCFGHHYANHQELESIIQVDAACRIWCLAFYFHILTMMHGQNYIKVMENIFSIALGVLRPKLLIL